MTASRVFVRALVRKGIDARTRFFCAIIAAITLRFLDPFGTGKLVMFSVTYDKVRLVVERKASANTAQDWHAYELIFFVILGIFGVRSVSSFFLFINV